MKGLLTTRSGLVHRQTCSRLPAITWKWDPRNDGPGVARACKVCLGGVLPGGAS